MNKLVLTALSCLFLLYLSCKRTYTYLDTQQAASAYILGDSNKKMVVWRRVKTFDPYEGGRTNTYDSSKQEILEIHADGKFLKRQPNRMSEGNWKLESNRSILVLFCTHINHKAVVEGSGGSKEVFTLRKLSRDTMILAWTGRHGMVEDLYVNRESKPKTL